MFKWFDDMRLGSKLLLSFMAIVVLVGGVVGGLGYFNVQQISGIVNEITQQRVPSVKNSTTVERYALRTLMDENNYLLHFRDAGGNPATIEQDAMSNIDQINTALTAVDAVATKYNDQALLGQSQSVRTIVAQYKDLFTQGVAKLAARQDAENTLATNGTAVEDQAQAYFEAKNKLNTDQARQAEAIDVNIWNTALQTRLHSKNYMLSQDPAEFVALQTGITTLNGLYDDLAKVSSGADDANRIDTARKATANYLAAAQTWKASDDSLNQILTQMDAIGTKVQDTAMAAEDAGWTATDASGTKASGVVSQAVTLTIVALLVALVLGLVLGVVIPRTITGPMSLVVTTGRLLADGDLVRDMDAAAMAKLRGRRDEWATWARRSTA